MRLSQSEVFFFPYLYKNPVTGSLKGIYYDMFTNSITKSFRCLFQPRVSDVSDEVPDENGTYQGVVGSVVRGFGDATIDDFAYSSDKVKLLRYAVPQTNFGQFAFYEKVQVINDWTIASFVVFPVRIIAIILAMFVLVRAVEFARHVVQVKLDIPHKDEHKLTSSLCMLGSFMLYLMYNSAFAGNASSSVSKPPSNISAMLSQLQSGEATMVLSDAFLGEDSISELFGRPQNEVNNLLIVPDLQKLTEMLCASTPQHNVYTYSVLYNIFSSNSTRSAIKCQLQTVNSQETEYINKQLKTFAGVQLETPYPTTFYFNRKRFTNRQVKFYNRIIEKLYDIEKMDGLWWRRFTGKAKQTFNAVPAKNSFSFTPLPMAAYNVILIIAGVLLSVSLLILVAETFHFFLANPDTYSRFIDV
ncbi:hypothetical protein PFISCL1PPCAC_26428 [Pristionchus fissidentatus]|uniref:Solute-binding protein family 3/N-terminal domain-containing protein n=1 Tax=Pristionchus fissidentatus TaxID=1538716 RepID=A0AAV5WS62_9BILA|nr:hypothetical protein PFISCL1PPCAC_26428 [Pristionchus fissidentatus]